MANITNKNAEDLWKAIKRLHKENGTYGEFIKLRIINERRKYLSGEASMNAITNEFLLPYCWAVFKGNFMVEGYGETESSIMASVRLLSIIDFLKSNDTLIIKKIIAKSEFYFIAWKISTIINIEVKMYAELKEKVNEALNKYSHLITKKDYEDIIESLLSLKRLITERRI